MHLVDDLLEVAAEQWRQDFEQAPVGPIAGEDPVEIGRPLHHAHDPPDPGVVGDAEEHVLMAEAPRVGQAPA